MQYRFSTADFFVRFKVARIARRHGVKATTRRADLVHYIIKVESPTRAFLSDVFDKFDVSVLETRTDSLERWRAVWPDQVF